MKKIRLIPFFLLALVFTFVISSCGGKSGLSEAVDYIHQAYKDDATTITTSFERPAYIELDSVKYNIAWTVAVAEDKGSAEAVSIAAGSSEKYTKISVNSYDVETEFVLTATVAKENSKKTESVSFTYTIPKLTIISYADFVAAEVSDSIVSVKGVIAGKEVFSSNATTVYLQDLGETGGYVGYKVGCTEAQYDQDLAIGKVVMISGPKASYNGLLEVGTSSIKASYVLLDTMDAPTATDITSLVSAGSDLSAYQGRAVKLTDAVITSVADGSTSSTRINFTLKCGAKTITAQANSYFMSTDDAKAVYTLTKDAVGAKVDFEGIMGWYNGAQLTFTSKTSLTLKSTAEELKSLAAASQVAALFDAKYIKGATITLPASIDSIEGVALTYAVTAGESVVSITDSVATITPPAEGSVDATITITMTCGGNTYTQAINFAVNNIPPTFDNVTGIIAANESLANKATSEEEFSVVGSIKAITTEYNATYGNITFTLTDGTKDIIVYRFKGGASFAVGDVLYLKGNVQKFNTDYELVNATVVSELTSLADASTAAAGVSGNNVKTEGTYTVFAPVTKITSAYSATYGNITFIISDGTDAITCYRLVGGETLKVGQYVAVTGYLTKYNTTYQFASDSTFIIEKTDRPVEEKETYVVTTLPFTESFEGTEFVAGSTYNSKTATSYGTTDGASWSLVYGAVATTGAIVGTKSIQMRYYASAATTFGTATSEFVVNGVKKITFVGAQTGSNSVKVEISTDKGATWTGAQTYTLGTTATECTYTLTDADNIMVRFTLVVNETPTDKSRVYIDSVAFLAE